MYITCGALSTRTGMLVREKRVLILQKNIDFLLNIADFYVYQYHFQTYKLLKYLTYYEPVGTVLSYTADCTQM